MYRFALEPRPRRWKQGSWLTLALLFTLLGLAPLHGGDVELKTPVSYARVKLPARAPTLVSLDLPPGAYNVEPHSLGYFNSNNEFVYTADEPRGLIYARSGDKVVVVELQAPVRAEDFMAQYLHRIREAVADLNARENELLQARQKYAGASGRAKQLASIPLSLSSVDLAQGFADWCARCADEGQSMVGSAHSALSQSADERDDLKRLFYESAKADIELELRTYDLQMALARLPRPQFADVLGDSDRDALRAKVLADLQLRQKGWVARRSELEQQQRMDLQWLASAALPAAVLSVGSVPVMVPASGAVPAPVDDGLRQDIQQARSSLSQAETEYLDSALAKVQDAIDYVQKGGVADSSQLPHIILARREFSDLHVSSLDGLSLVEASAVKPVPASGVLLDLAQKFEKAGEAQPLKLNSTGGVSSVECYPREVAYGLMIVDRCRRIETQAAGRPDGIELADRLAQMLAKPADFGAAGNDLGYIEFMRWYAQQTSRPAEKLAHGLESEAKQATAKQ